MADRPIHVRRARKNDENPYVQILRTTAQDATLSWEARGVLTYLLSKPDTWVLQPADLKQGCGRDKVYAIINELIEARYIARTIERDALGRMTACYYDIDESPMALETVSTGDSAPFPDLPDTALPDTAQPDPAKPDSRYKRLLDKKEEDSLATFVPGAPNCDADRVTPVRDIDIELDEGVIDPPDPIQVVSESNGQLSFATQPLDKPVAETPPTGYQGLVEVIALRVFGYKREQLAALFEKNERTGKLKHHTGIAISKIASEIKDFELVYLTTKRPTREDYAAMIDNVRDAQWWIKREMPTLTVTKSFAEYYTKWVNAGRPRRPQGKQQAAQFTLGFAEPQQRWIPGVGMVLDKLSGGYEIIEPVAKIEREAKGA